MDFYLIAELKPHWLDDLVTPALTQPTEVRVTTRSVSYAAESASHTWVDELVTRLSEGRVPGLEASDTATKPDGSDLLRLDSFLADYAPSPAVVAPHPVDDLDFSPGGSYSIYNWELFFHVPLTIGINLSRSGRYADAQRWFHHIFDPTTDEVGPEPDRFWKVKPFRGSDAELIANVLRNLSSNEDPILRQRTIDAIGAWQDAPYRPHLVASYRPTAYRYKTVMAYLDNLIEWGDSLFAQDTGEAIDEATQLYVLAAQLLGRRPQPAPRHGTVRPATYNSLRPSLDAFGNALLDIESAIPFDALPPASTTGDAAQLGVLSSIGRDVYFCVPHNDRILTYYDTIADRLFKIRNSLNLQGVFRRLPLFDPPIDPGMLARAVAAGVDVAAALSAANQPLPLVRFSLLMAKATELAQEVRTLGGSLLSAIEKQDGEALGVLRARHETAALDLARSVKYAQWQEATKTREGLERTLESAEHRYQHFEALLGTTASALVERESLDTDALTTAEPDGFASTEDTGLSRRSIEVRIDKEQLDDAGLALNPAEASELDELARSRALSTDVEAMETLGAFMGLIPTFSAKFEPFGAGGSLSFGGSNLSALFNGFAAAMRSDVSSHVYRGTNHSKMAGYQRRQQDWEHQSNLALDEMTQILKQVRAAEIREWAAKREFEAHLAQVARSHEIDEFLAGEVAVNTGGTATTKTTTTAFYNWARRELRGLHNRVLDLALDVARKAERALAHELGDPDLRFLGSSYSSGREGLLAGERLLLDLRRMEMAHLEANRREYEVVKHVSLASLDPVALATFRRTGRCTMRIPEEYLDLDLPSQYFARIRSVSLTIPSVAGPYTGVHCTARLLKSQVRTSPVPGDYASDENFDTRYASLEAIVTSSGRNDSGMFETTLNDERYLPFEGHGVISEWDLALPTDFRQFDYSTITDVIVHLRFTAREGGERLARAAVSSLVERIGAATASGSVRLLSVRSDFPTEWAAFKAGLGANGPAGTLELDLGVDRLPFWARALVQIEHTRVSILASTPAGETVSVKVGDAASQELVSPAEVAGLVGVDIPPAEWPAPAKKVHLTIDDRDAVDDLWVLIHWTGRVAVPQ